MSKNIVIFDLDGTLANIDHRRHLVEKNMAFQLWFNAMPEDRQKLLKVYNPPELIVEKFLEDTGWKPNWDAFYAECVNDTPVEQVMMMFKLLRLNGYTMYILSGRSEAVREQTIEWLNTQRLYCDKLFMRKVGSFIPDETLKSIWLKEIGVENIYCVFDDRMKVVKMHRDMGLVCFQVAEGNF